MADEFKHASVGTDLSQAEWESTTGHVLNNQATGDLVYASSATQLSRLAVGTSGQMLTVSGGIPAWGAGAAAEFVKTTKTTGNYYLPGWKVATNSSTTSVAFTTGQQYYAPIYLSQAASFDRVSFNVYSVATPSFTSVANAQLGTSASSWTPTITGHQANDVYVFIVTLDQQYGNLITGFTRPSGYPYSYGVPYVDLQYKLETSGTTPSYTYSYSTSSYGGSGHLIRVRGVDTTTPIDTNHGTNATAVTAAATLTTPSVTTATANAAWLWWIQGTYNAYADGYATTNATNWANGTTSAQLTSYPGWTGGIVSNIMRGTSFGWGYNSNASGRAAGAYGTATMNFFDYAYSAPTTQYATTGALSFRANSTNQGFKLALYADNNGAPGARLSNWGTATVSASGVIATTISESLAAGRYWISWASGNSTIAVTQYYNMIAPAPSQVATFGNALTPQFNNVLYETVAYASSPVATASATLTSTDANGIPLLLRGA